MKPTDPLTKHLSSLKKTQLQALKKLSIETINDLLYHFPNRYTDAAEEFDGTLKKGQETTLIGTIEKINMRRTSGKKRIMIAEASLYTGAQKIRAVWFNQPYIAHQYNQGDIVEITGKIAGEKKPYFTNPIIKHNTEQPKNIFTDNNTNTDTRKELIAIYPETKGISSLWFRTNIEKVLAQNNIKNIEDPIPKEVCNRLNLPNYYDAFIYIHKPTTQNEYEAAKKRFAFEQTFALQVTQHIAKNTRLTTQAYNLSINTKKNRCVYERAF